MSAPPEPRKTEQPSTYFVQDKEKQEELERLDIQDHMITKSMGGVLAEQPDPTLFRRVLDVACGPGGWTIDAALAYPALSLIGIDISQRMIEFARTQAAAHQLSDRVEFHVMDALRMLEFPDKYFDLVNMRLGSSFLRTWDWPKLLSEFLRVTRPGGVVRITDSQVVQQSTSPALTQIFEMFVRAFYRAGHFFAEESTGLTAHLPRLLTRYGYNQVQTKVYALEYRPGTPAWQAYYGVLEHSQTMFPFLKKWGCAPENLTEVYQQVLVDARQSSFHVTWNLTTAWGTKPK